MMDKNEELKTWRTATIVAMAVVVLLSGVNGALLDTGFGDVIELLIGMAFGVIAVGVAALLISGLRRLLGSVPAMAVAGIGGALLALWLLYSQGHQQAQTRLRRHLALLIAARR